jgi:cysteine desulfurase
LDCQIDGGGHQDGLRSGTLAVPLIAGFGKACELASGQLADEIERLGNLRDRFEQRILRGAPVAIVNGNAALRLPNITSISFPSVDSEALLTSLMIPMGSSGNPSCQVAVSAGSACTSASLKPSHVLTAMGVSPDVARSTLRLSVGRFNTREEVDVAAEAITQSIQQLLPGGPPVTGERRILGVNSVAEVA